MERAIAKWCFHNPQFAPSSDICYYCFAFPQPQASLARFEFYSCNSLNLSLPSYLGPQCLDRAWQSHLCQCQLAQPCSSLLDPLFIL
jgi:hypothetical protein